MLPNVYQDQINILSEFYLRLRYFIDFKTETTATSVLKSEARMASMIIHLLDNPLRL